MIHEITEDVLKKNLSAFDIITFDDGLYSQYMNLEHFLKLPQPKYFFISTNIVCSANQSNEVIYCGDAHKKAFNGNFENYMTWEQIKEIYNTHNCFIGGHSHNHTKINSLKENIRDTDTMINEFKKHNIIINSYCYPYNYENSLRTMSVKKHKINNFFGKNRVAIEKL